jgi:hypothetical protein
MAAMPFEKIMEVRQRRDVYVVFLMLEAAWDTLVGG